MQKILFVITKGTFGGAQRYVYDLAMNLPKDRFSVAVAIGTKTEGTHAGGHNLLAEMLENDVQTLEIPAMQRDVSLLNDLRTFTALLAMMKSEAPDIVHLNSSKAGGLGALAARLAGVPRIIFTIHGLPADEDRSFLARSAIALVTWLTALLSHHTILVSHDALVRMQKFPFLARKTSHILNGLRSDALLSRQEARSALVARAPNLPKDAPLIGTIAELHPNKDLDTALESIAHVDDAHYILFGEGEMRAHLEARAAALSIRERVHFLGFVENAARYLPALDVFLFTSRKEGLPYVLLEAGAAGVPIVAVDIPGTREVLQDSTYGALTPRDPLQIAASLHDALAKTDATHARVDALKTRIARDFSFETMLKETIALYGRH